MQSGGWDTTAAPYCRKKRAERNVPQKLVPQKLVPQQKVPQQKVPQKLNA